MKFDPLININKQNVVKKILNIWFFKRLSKKVNFDVVISKFKKATDRKTKVICSKNLFLADINIFWSDKNPNKKVRNIAIM